MTKSNQKNVISKMLETIGFIKDVEKNSDAFYSADIIRGNMGNYFAGLAFALSAATGNEYNWSNGTDGNTWCLVENANTDKEIRYPVE